MKTYCLEVSGDFACFTRPEMKVERVSYDVITPSAARAVFEAILWKPAIRWQVSKIEVLNPIKWINLRRNEVGAVASTRNVETAMKSGTVNWVCMSKTSASNAPGLFLARREVPHSCVVRIARSELSQAELSASEQTNSERRRGRFGKRTGPDGEIHDHVRAPRRQRPVRQSTVSWLSRIRGRFHSW